MREFSPHSGAPVPIRWYFAVEFDKEFQSSPSRIAAENPRLVKGSIVLVEDTGDFLVSLRQGEGSGLVVVTQRDISVSEPARVNTDGPQAQSGALRTRVLKIAET